MLELWQWLLAAWRKADQLMFLVTLGGVAAAVYYASLTRKLARAAVRQAEAAKDQAEASKTAAQASELQARVTQQAFEAAQRPYLDVRIIGEDSFFTRPDLFSVSFRLKNHGSVPAIFVGWTISVRQEDNVLASRAAEPSDSQECLFPGDTTSVTWRTGERGDIRTPPDIQIPFTIAYRGFSGSEYRTRIVASLFQGRVWRWVYDEIT